MKHVIKFVVVKIVDVVMLLLVCFIKNGRRGWGGGGAVNHNCPVPCAILVRPCQYPTRLVERKMFSDCTVILESELVFTFKCSYQ